MYLSTLPLYFVFFFASFTMFIYFILMYSVCRTERNKGYCIVLICVFRNIIVHKWMKSCQENIAVAIRTVALLLSKSDPFQSMVELNDS